MSKKKETSLISKVIDLALDVAKVLLVLYLVQSIQAAFDLSDLVAVILFILILF